MVIQNGQCMRPYSSNQRAQFIYPRYLQMTSNLLARPKAAAIPTTPELPPPPPSTSAAPSLLTPRNVAPGLNCGRIKGWMVKCLFAGPLDKCTGGSICIGGFCLCPAGMAPSSQGVCEARQLPVTSAPSILEEVVRPRELF
jgi:hypothetical protein